MSTPIDSGGPAFPSPSISTATDDRNEQRDGMTLRDWFAGQAVSGMNMSADYFSRTNDEAHAKRAYFLADAMIAARKANP